MPAVYKESDDLVYRHFYSHGHHGLPDVSIQLTDIVNDKYDLLAKEGHWVYRIHSIKTDGHNESDFFLTTIEGNVAVSKKKLFYS